jgi:hypothetical protein
MSSVMAVRFAIAFNQLSIQSALELGDQGPML